MKKPKISVIIPAYNEEEKITETIQGAKKIGFWDEIIVVNDSSEDRTAALAKKAGAQVINLTSNMGKGAALTRGVQEAQGDILLLLDGDLGYTAGDSIKLLYPLLEEKADMTIAKFPPVKKKSGFGLVKGTARLGIKLLAGVWLEEPLSGQRGITRRLLEEVKTFHSGYGVEVGLSIAAARRGFRIMEVNTQMTHKVTGRDLQGFWHRGKQFGHVVRALWTTWREG